LTQDACKIDRVHVFIDDSGCGGFKIGQGSSSHLVMAACVFRDPLQIELLAEVAEQCRVRRSHRREFRYSRCNDKLRDAFFECIAPVGFHVRAIVMDKSQIYSPELRANPAKFRSYAIRMLLTKNFGQIKDAKVVIDGQSSKAFGVNDSDYLTRMVNREAPGTISSVKFDDSRYNIGIQLADMCAGAINRGVQTHRPSDPRHLVLIRPRTYQPRGTLWHFGWSTKVDPLP